MANSKLEIRNPKQITNHNNQTSKLFDLEDRTYEFAKSVRNLTFQLKKTLANIEYIKQLVRSSGSVAANYIEANEALSKKDFIMRVKICKKEAKESRLWLRLIETNENPSLESEKVGLFNECTQLMKIFGAILEKSK